MKALEDIFQDYFACPTPFDYQNGGELTEEGIVAYTRLLSLLEDLDTLGVGVEMGRVADRIDEIIDGTQY